MTKIIVDIEIILKYTFPTGAKRITTYRKLDKNK